MTNDYSSAKDLGRLDARIDGLQEQTAKEADLLRLELKLEKIIACHNKETSKRIEENTRWAAAFVIGGVIGQVMLNAALIRFFGHFLIQQP